MSPASQSTSPRRRPLLLAALAVLIALTLLAAAARWSWVGELAASFRWYLGWIALALGLAALLFGRKGAGALAPALLLVLGLWHVLPEARLYWPRALHGHPGDSWTLVTGNLRWGNDDFEGVQRWLRDLAPDVVVAQEVSPRWRAALAELRPEYPYQVFSPPEPSPSDEWGTAVLARIPFDRTRLIEAGADTFRPLIEVALTLHGESVLLRTAHPIRPAEPDAWRRRNAILGTFADQAWNGRALLVGDLNTTSTSPIFGDLLSATGLRDSRRGFGRQPTFVPPPNWPLVRVAIDHVLVGAQVQVLERRTELLPGSDHRAVFARLALAGK